MAVRQEVFDRAGWRCQSCGNPGRLECDHIVPLRRGGEMWDLDNLQALCPPCHRTKTKAESGRPDTPEAARWREFRDELR